MNSSVVIMSRDTYALDERVNCVVVVPGIFAVESLNKTKIEIKIACCRKN